MAFLNLAFNYRSISIQLFADSGSSNINTLEILMPIMCKACIWIGEGSREERKKESIVSKPQMRNNICSNAFIQ